MLIKAQLRESFRDEVLEVWFWVKRIPFFIYFLWYVAFKWGKKGRLSNGRMHKERD
jgi:hypothetical protein